MNTSGSTTALLGWFDRHRRLLWLGIGLLLLAGFNGQWRIGPDSAIHVTVARNLAQGDGFTQPTGLETTIHPGLALVTAATFRLFGIDNFVAIDIFMLLCAAAVLVLTYGVVRLRVDRPTAVLVVCMLAVNETFYRYGYQVLTDMPFLLGLMLMLLGLELFHRGKNDRWIGIGLIVVSILVMAAFRSVVLTVLIAGVLAFVSRAITGPRRCLYAAVAGGGLIVLVLTIWVAGGDSLLRDGDKAMSLVGGGNGQTIHRLFTDNGPELLTEHLPESMFGADLGTWAGIPLGVIAIVVGLALYRLQPMWGLLVLVFVVQWLLLITTKRYVLVLIPLLALGWWRCVCWLEMRTKPALMPWVVIGLLAMWFGPNLVRVGKFVVEQRTRPFLANFEKGRYVTLISIADSLKTIAQDGDVILADNAPQLTYLTGLPVYGPATLPTFGPQRDQTIQRMRDAQRILLVSPTNGMLNERISQLKLRRVEVLSVLPTPEYEHIHEFKIIRMRIRSINWDEYRKRRELQQGAGTTQQGDTQPQQKTSESEQPDHQPQ